MEHGRSRGVEAPGAEDDGSLPPLADFLVMLAGLDGAEGGGTAETIRVDLPVELELESRGEAGLAIGMSPPTQRTETTVLPVFHRLTLHIVRDGSE